ncbi:hypothetical protein [Micromonospora sp. NPDC005305]|uniref:hypothetical protein n=1 Tax=Micromonospora sp. NPDC005305 TaxID=3156875 RepID=UPI0033ABED9D
MGEEHHLVVGQLVRHHRRAAVIAFGAVIASAVYEHTLVEGLAKCPKESAEDVQAFLPLHLEQADVAVNLIRA